MKRLYIIIIVFLTCYSTSIAQTSKEFISDLSTVTVLNKFRLSNEFMRELKENNFKEIPTHLISLWNSKETKYVNENNDERAFNEKFFNECVRPIGKIVMRNSYTVVLFCKFEDEGTQKYGMMVSYDNAGNILSTQHCYDEIFEMTGFFKKNGTTNQMVILTSGEEFATEDIITLNSNGLFQTISYKEIENYNFD